MLNASIALAPAWPPLADLALATGSLPTRIPATVKRILKNKAEYANGGDLMNRCNMNAVARDACVAAS